METKDFRYAALLMRCSDGARRHLVLLPQHPLIHEILDALEAKDGTIGARDVEDCFLEVTMRHAVDNDKAL